MLREFLVAVSFLTRLPVPADVHTVGHDVLRRALAWFPLVGAMLTTATAVLIELGLVWWPVPVAVLLALAIEARVTGLMHEDALADVADAFGGGRTREDVHRILKDSRLGTYGTTALVLGLALRAAALVYVPPEQLVLALALSGAVGRLGIVGVMSALPPAPGRRSLTEDLGPKDGLRLFGHAALIVSPLLLLGLVRAPLSTTAGLALAAVAAAYVGRLSLRKLEGMSGDAVGAVGFLGQLAVLLAFAAH